MNLRHKLVPDGLLEGVPYIRCVKCSRTGTENDPYFDMRCPAASGDFDEEPEDKLIEKVPVSDIYNSYMEDKINELVDEVNKLKEEVRSLKNQTNRV